MSARHDARYLYVKEEPAKPLLLILSDYKTKLFSAFLMFTGVLIISWVAWPILSFKFLVAPKFVQIITPLPETKLPRLAGSAPKVNAQEPSPTKAEPEKKNDTSVDYTQASNWFPQITQEKTQQAGSTYTISIPKLNIQDARVKVGGEDLNKNLVHYGGTALPGEYGNAVIFGHSTLPYFYDPTNYRTIFSKLPEMEKGDKIFIRYDGLEYRFKVENMFVVKPRDIQILEQHYDDAYITLVTCVPPGTYLERLVVKARLQNI